MSIERHSHDVFLFDYMGYCGRRSNAAGESPIWLRRCYHNRLGAISVVFTLAAAIEVLDMFAHVKLGRDHNKFFGNLLADDMSFMAARTNQLFLGKDELMDTCRKEDLPKKNLTLRLRA